MKDGQAVVGDGRGKYDEKTQAAIPKGVLLIDLATQIYS
jgi:hypothetical protein